MRICIINLFFGKLPVFYPLFIESCRNNPDIDFLLVGDHPLSEIGRNIKLVEMNIDQFNALIIEKTGIMSGIKHPYKICDFKPLFGVIFKDFLNDYSFWGYCDIDLVFGNLSNFISPEVLQKYDILNCYRGFSSGPFCLYRNNSLINQLYRRVFNYQEILSKENYIGLDENIQRTSNRGFTIKKIVLFVPFYLKEILSGRNSYRNFLEIRYQFQWFYKRNSLQNNQPYDISEAMWQASSNKEINVFFKELILSGFYCNRNNHKKWEVFYQNGELYFKPENVKIFGFHFNYSSSSFSFKDHNFISTGNYVIKTDGIFNR